MLETQGRRRAVAVRKYRSPDTHPHVRDDDVHRDVMFHRMDCFQLLRLETHSNSRHLREIRQRSVEVPASVTKPVAGSVEADQGRYDEIRANFLSPGRNGNVPNAFRQRFTGLPFSTAMGNAQVAPRATAAPIQALRSGSPRKGQYTLIILPSISGNISSSAIAITAVPRARSSCDRLFLASISRSRSVFRHVVMSTIAASSLSDPKQDEFTSCREHAGEENSAASKSCSDLAKIASFSMISVSWEQSAFDIRNFPLDIRYLVAQLDRRAVVRILAVARV